MQRRTAVIALSAACTGWPWIAAAQSDGLQSLELFLAQVQQGRATFTQTVSAPARSGEATRRTRSSRGEFIFLRPDRFRFHYTHPFEQLIVADGQTLWLYDPDLNQVTARAQAAALAQTPASALAAAADLRAVREAFELREGQPRDGLLWVELTPRARDTQVQQVRIGFEQAELRALEIRDGFGQISLLRFGPLQRTSHLSAADFRFSPPPGAEVLRP
ncbi:outer membrane lipoprotein chaperone LolA [Tepidimonas charontis]|uniref:Outer-membrane lipoprotein carrier protein n=1 Tax=Tepidimonas charontis TaxID=2267262 RepID=A0A554XB77_9BURK|nr:outer membrane lipoprotein chaperone LolA [Tepidimonas charontis]TSE33068.1 Outer-membrane lipoprotein carrier protein [Tepidimonas charontis]